MTTEAADLSVKPHSSLKLGARAFFLHKWARDNLEPILAVALSDHSFCERIMPLHVRVAIIISLLLGLYALVFSVPLCLIGSFVGPQILIPGVLHAVLGAVLLVGCQGILSQQRWARWLMVLVSGLVVFAVPIWIARDSLQAGSVPDGALFSRLPGFICVTRVQSHKPRGKRVVQKMKAPFRRIVPNELSSESEPRQISRTSRRGRLLDAMILVAATAGVLAVSRGPEWMAMLWIWGVHSVIGAVLSAPIVFLGRKRAQWCLLDLLVFLLPFSVWGALMNCAFGGQESGEPRRAVLFRFRDSCRRPSPRHRRRSRGGESLLDRLGRALKPCRSRSILVDTIASRVIA